MVPDQAAPWRPLRRTLELLEMIKFQHSLFALPFGLTALIVAARGLPDLRTALLVVACMVSARTAAMTWNRIADRRFDAENPRTRERALPAGRVRLAEAWTLLALSCAGFVAASAGLNRLTLLLSPVALATVLGYSLAKRVTPLTHFLLGLSLALAPIGAWIAVRGRLEGPPLLLGLGVAAWTAGFDLLYACQDVDFDRAAGLHSLPARLGVVGSLRVSEACHLVAVASFCAFGLAAGLGLGWWLAMAVASALLLAAHAIVRPDDLSRVGLAFFQLNVGVGAAVLAGAAWDVLRAA